MGQLYAARMFIEGDDLHHRIGAGWTFAEVARIITEVAEALDYAHQKGVVHGFVHPRHVLLGNDGSAWLIGFGEYWPTQPEVVGNPLHLAPEQCAAGGVATPATDVYALAETALWMLCGQHPFATFPGLRLLEAKHSDKLHERIGDLLPDAPAAVEVLHRGLLPDPARRYAKAGELAASLSSSR